MKGYRYYYAFEEKIPLKIAAGKYVIRYSSEPNVEIELEKLKSHYELLDTLWIDSRTAIVQTQASETFQLLSWKKRIQRIRNQQQLMFLILNQTHIFCVYLPKTMWRCIKLWYKIEKP